MIEQRRNLGERQLTVGRALHHTEQRPELTFGGDERRETRSQHDHLARDRQCCLAAVWIGAHRDCTAPELSSATV